MYFVVISWAAAWQRVADVNSDRRQAAVSWCHQHLQSARQHLHRPLRSPRLLLLLIKFQMNDEKWDDRSYLCQEPALPYNVDENAAANHCSWAAGQRLRRGDRTWLGRDGTPAIANADALHINEMITYYRFDRCRGRRRADVETGECLP